MKFGRPGHGYYLQRYPNEQTWFGSEIKLNQHDILQDIKPKTSSEYKQREQKTREEYEKREATWPYLSEYSDRFARKTSTQTVSSK